MALSVTYNVVNGVILSETRGGVDTIYVPDTNGSLIECRNASGNQTYSAEYWPYGEVQTETGSKANPWGFGGLVGYLRDLGNLLYVRARHLRVDLCRWQTKDPLWPSMQAYGYVLQSPARIVDPSGLAPGWPGDCAVQSTCKEKYDCCIKDADLTQILLLLCGAIITFAMFICGRVCGPPLGFTQACWTCLLVAAAAAVGCLTVALIVYLRKRQECADAYAACNQCPLPEPPNPQYFGDPVYPEDRVRS